MVCFISMTTVLGAVPVQPRKSSSKRSYGWMCGNSQRENPACTTGNPKNEKNEAAAMMLQAWMLDSRRRCFGDEFLGSKNSLLHLGAITLDRSIAYSLYR